MDTNTAQAENAGPSTDTTAGLPLDDFEGIEAAFAAVMAGPSATPAPEVPQAPAAEAQQPEAVPAAQQIEAEIQTPALEDASSQEGPLKGRIGVKQFSPDTQRAIVMLRELNNGKPEGEGPYTLADTLAMVASANSGKSITLNAPQQQPTEQTPPAPTPTDTLRQEVADLEAYITEAGENQELFGPDLAKATIELGRKQAALLASEAVQSQVSQSSIDAHVSAMEAVKAAVVKEYKGAHDPTCAHGARVATLIEELKDPAHPDHWRLSETSAPKYISDLAAEQTAEKLSTQLGIPKEQILRSFLSDPAAASQPLQPPPQPPQPQPVAGNRSVTAPGAAAFTAPAAVSGQQLLAASFDDPNFDFDAALGYRGGAVIR